MKKQFPGYYRPNTEEFAEKFKECVFCFDTNVLLNLYRYTPQSRDNLIKVLQVLKERVWLPHQVGLEYQRNRTEVLLAQLGLCSKIEGIINSATEEIAQLRRSSLFAVNTMIDPIKQDLEAVKAKIQEKKQKQPDLMTGDPVFDAVTELFDGKVGAPNKPEEYKDFYKKGKERYDAKIPPGYKDKSNNPNDVDQYGDLILWFQLMDYAKLEPRPIILVTDDAKEDWWKDVNGEKLGPRPELINEFIDKVGDGKWFYMYSTEQFLKHAIEYLGVDITSEAIREAEGIEKQDTEQETNRTLSSNDVRHAFSTYENYAKAVARAHAINQWEDIFQISPKNKPNNPFSIWAEWARFAELDNIKSANNRFIGGSPCQMSGQKCPREDCDGIMDVSEYGDGVTCSKCRLFIPAG